jgi:16S rRNA (guanine527-N7)-methyltransferase
MTNPLLDWAPLHDAIATHRLAVDAAALIPPLELLQAELVAANERFNLTRLTAGADYVVKHVVDSLLLLAVLPQAGTAVWRVADVGCGPGFPGLPLALACPKLRVAEVESNLKKHQFVAELLPRLSLAERCTAVRGRARELARQKAHCQRYHLVVARAVGQTAELIEECQGLLARDGWLVAYKSPPSVAEERNAAAVAARRARLTLRESPILALPGEAGLRQFVLLQAAHG